jgi:2-desacetyl-2-hydroxyethyl bacteriochlorophyllide A dehydrogenase
MKELYINSPGVVEFREADMPKRNENEAVLKLLYGGICGSDLGSYRGTFAYFSYPRIPGHEFSAEIVDIDENNSYGLKKGMVVTCNPYFNCGKCYPCRKGLVNVCEHNETMGSQRNGAFRDYIVMPLERIYDGRGLDARTLAVVEPFCIGLHGINHVQLKKGVRVLVIGSGTIGIFAATAAKMKGATVIMADISENKLQMAKQQFGIDDTILNDSHENFLSRVMEKTDGCGFDVCVEAVGLPSTFQDCIDAACFGGSVILIGIGKKNLDFNFTIIQKKELHIYGSRNALKQDFIETIDALLTGKLDLGKAITDVYAFSEAPKAFAEFSANQGDKLKVLLDFSR